MASTLKINTLTGVSTAGSIAVTGEGNSTTTNLQQGLAKVWCQFDGTGTIAIENSFNSSSLTDVGTGDYTVHMTNSLSPDTGSYFANSNQMHAKDVSSDDAGIIRLGTFNTSHSATDASRVYTGKFGDLA